MLLAAGQQVLRVSVSAIQVSCKAAKRTWNTYKIRRALGEAQTNHPSEPFALHEKLRHYSCQRLVVGNMICHHSVSCRGTPDNDALIHHFFSSHLNQLYGSSHLRCLKCLAGTLHLL